MHVVQDLLQGGKVDGRLARLLGHAESATQVDAAHIREALGQSTQQMADLVPVAHVEHAAAGMCVQAHDARAHAGDKSLELVEFEERDAKLRMHAGRPDVVVMTATVAGVDADQDVAAAERFTPMPQRMQVVERDPHALRERPLVLLARREIRREQHLAPVDVRHHLQDASHLALRDALEGESGAAHDLQDLRVRIGLDRVEDLPDAAQREELRAGTLEGRPIVHVGAAALVRDAHEFRPARPPPRRPADRRLRADPVDLLPRRTEHAIRGRVLHGELVQALHEPVTLLLVDDEGQVQVDGGLRDEVDLLLLEELERVAEAMQRRADVAPDQAHRRARSDHLHAAQARQRGDQRLDRAVVECVRRRVEGHGDARLRGGHQVDRQPVLLEHRESIGEEADLVPHAERLHRDERDALLDADGLDARAAVAARRGDHRALHVRQLGGMHRDRYGVLLGGQDAARVQHLCAAARDFLRLVVVERLEQARVRHRARIRREHPGHVRPDLEAAGPDLRGEVAARGVGSAAAEQDGVALRVARDEPLREEHPPAAGEAALQRKVRLEAAGGRQVAGALGSARALFCMEKRAGVEPLYVEALGIEERRAEPRSHEFAGGHYACAKPVTHLADELDARRGAAQVGEMTFEIRVGRQAEITREVVVTSLDLFHDGFPVPVERPCEQLLEAVGDAGQRGVHQNRTQAFGEAGAYDASDIPPVTDARDAGAAELEYDPVRFGGAGHRAVPGAAPGIRSRGRE